MDVPDCYMSGGLAAMLRLSRLAGLAPLKFVKKGSGWRVSLSPEWSYYGYLIVTVIIVATVGSLVSDLQLEQEESLRMNSNTRRVVWIVDVACMLLIAGTSVYGAPTQLRAMIGYMTRIEKINLELNSRKWPVHCDETKIHFFFFWVALTIILTVTDYLIPISNIKMDQDQKWINLMYLFYYCCYWILQLRELNIVMVTLHVMYCFRSINSSLKTLLHELADVHELNFMTLFNNNLCMTTKKKLLKVNVKTIADSKKLYSGTQKRSNHHETVRRLALAYAKTCDVVRDVDNAHGLIVLMILGSFLLHLVCTPYYVITSMFNNNNTSSLEADWATHIFYVSVQLVWCFYHAVNLLMIIEPCHLTQMEMESTCELVSHLMRCTDSMNDPIATELDFFYKHIFLNQASYSAMHVTTISRSLVATILGSITTYLVIIIQLQ